MAPQLVHLPPSDERKVAEALCRLTVTSDD